MTRGESGENEFEFDLQVITSVGDQTTGGYPEDFDRIGTIRYTMWEFEFDPKDPYSGVQQEFVEVGTHLCTEEDFEKASYNIRRDIVGTVRENSICIDEG
jgi:hypothetical protein